MLDELGILPLASRRRSGETSEVGGGAMTDGDGIVSRALRDDSRSGEETGGGTTAALVICTGEREISELATPGAGGTTVAASEGAARALSRETVGAGATIAAPSAGAIRVWSRETFGAGGITAAFNAGVLSCCSRERLGAGAITDSRVSPPRV